MLGPPGFFQDIRPFFHEFAQPVLDASSSRWPGEFSCPLEDGTLMGFNGDLMVI